MTTKLFLIRHGQTNWNYKKRYCSFTDIDLNEKGIKQAKRLYQRLHKEKIHKVYSSDNKRTMHFARIAFKGFPIKSSPELREMNFGILEGLTYKELMERYAKIYKRWLNNPFNTDIPHGEGLSDFRKRVRRIFKKIISLNRDKTVAIVTHAGPIKIIVSDILKLKDIWGINPDLASLTIIEFERGKGKILLLNDTS